jgi:predicted metalloprotease with PDZ domain
MRSQGGRIRQNKVLVKRFLTASLFLGALPLLSFADVKYNVRVNPAAKNLSVRMQIDGAKESETVRIPAWCPGFYFLLDYEKALFDVNAVNLAGKKLATKKLDSRAIQISNPTKEPIVITYRIQGLDTGLGFFRTHVRATSAFINGPSAFLYADDHMTEKHSVKFNIPTGWDIGTAMDHDGQGNYSSTGYDELADHPIQLGRFVRRSFKVEGIPFEAIWVGDPAPRCDVDAETERLRRGSIPAIKMMKKVPFKRYLYLIHLEVGDFAGGLEHRASTTIAVGNSQTVHLDELATHEYYHSWNVKQIRPKILGPFDYTKQQRTVNLWFSEGVTDYYAKLHAFQAGLTSESQLLDGLRDEIRTIERSETRKKMTLEQVCYNTWEDSGFGGFGDLSFYNMGLVAGFVLDASIRHESSGKKSLDDVMRLAYDRYALPKPGFEEGALRDLVIEVGGAKLGPIYDALIRTAGNELPYAQLERLGLRLTIPGKEYVDAPFVVNEAGTIIKVIGTETGLLDGDNLVLVEPSSTDQLKVTITRGGQQKQVTVKARKYKANDTRLTRNILATAEESARRAEWLKGSGG